MTPKQLLQKFVNGVEIEAQITESDTQTTPIQANESKATTTVLMNIEGKIHMIDVFAVDRGVYDGLSA